MVTIRILLLVRMMKINNWLIKLLIQILIIIFNNNRNYKNKLI